MGQFYLQIRNASPEGVFVRDGIYNASYVIILPVSVKVMCSVVVDESWVQSDDRISGRNTNARPAYFIGLAKINTSICIRNGIRTARGVASVHKRLNRDCPVVVSSRIQKGSIGGINWENFALKSY